MVNNLSSVVLVFLLFAVYSYAIPVVDVNAICKQTQNPSFCVNLLNSKPGADSFTLTQYTTDVARANITNTFNLINKLVVQSANDPKAQSHYKSCLESFGYIGALGNAEHIQFLIERGNYQGVASSASEIQKNVDTCISEGSPPFPDRSVLPQYASVVKVVAQIILILSKSM